MSNKRNRRGHRLIRRLAESHTATHHSYASFIFWPYRDEMKIVHRLAMEDGLTKGRNFLRNQGRPISAHQQCPQTIVIDYTGAGKAGSH